MKLSLRPIAGVLMAAAVGLFALQQTTCAMQETAEHASVTAHHAEDDGDSHAHAPAEPEHDESRDECCTTIHVLASNPNTVHFSPVLTAMSLPPWQPVLFTSATSTCAVFRAPPRASSSPPLQLRV